jgi:hypothetical protein
MPSSFDNIKDIQFVITLSTGTFGSSSNNQVTLQGFRASVDIDKGGGQMFGQLRASIWGVSASDINSITTLQYQPRTLNPNTITVTAVDGQQQTVVFQGNIVTAWGVYNQPEVYLQIVAQAAYFNQLQAVSPTSYQGSVDVATAMSQLAGQMGYTFENNGVSGVTLSNPYLSGTAIDQANALAQAAGIWWGIDNGVLFIAPAYTARTAGKVIPQIGLTSGLIGYPTFDGAGITLQSLFNPSVKFMGLIQLVTSVPRAAGQWIATTVSYKLQSQVIGGVWFMTIRGNFAGISSPD